MRPLRQLDYQAPNDPEEFPSLRVVELESFNEVQPGTLEFAQDAKRAEAERARRLGLCVNLDDNEEEDDAGPSWRHGGGGGDGGQGCSTWAPKDEPSDDDDGGGDYDVFYRRLVMN
jgi:hypothetical protein